MLRYSNYSNNQKQDNASNPKNNLNYSQIGVNKVIYKRYNLESPYTQNNDFDSPERKYDYNGPSHFRNIPLEKIKGITPIYQEKVSMGTPMNWKEVFK